ncbi:hypothetical protein [Xylophilus sp.]|uniref:hypothetical protein n=1 Tax=Xylophilus sp. TaxID=2653893 RepID=UPI0013B82CAC|nr:hypothetical protein [Xylophilus sp.]KAF1045619.1 MAG: hypothetical protein GAK38_02911 [Xylophilus sp.]
MSDLHKRHLAALRKAVSGLRFSDCPELFKDIEATKAQMRAAGLSVPAAIARR